MMRKIMIWGVGNCAKNITSILNLEDFLVGFIETKRKTDQHQVGDKMYRIYEPKEVKGLCDCIIIGSSYEHDIRNTIEQYELKEIQVYSWNQESDKEKLLNMFPVREDVEVKKCYIQSAKYMPYQVIEVDNSYYMANSSDDILKIMIESGNTFSKREMTALFEIIGAESEGYFFDIGANIGTTSIFIKKNICNSLKVIAFEPVKSTFDLLHINCILNSVPDIVIENIGLSSEKGSAIAYIDSSDSGKSSVLSNMKGKREEKILLTTLDNYVLEQNINSNDIKCIWCDVEGIEDMVIQGGIKTLTNSSSCLYVEYNIQEYRKRKVYDSFVKILQNIYAKFICMEEYLEGIKDFHAIDELYKIDDIKKYRDSVNLLFLK